MNEDINLDELVVAEGQEFDETKSSIKSGDAVVDEIDKMIYSASYDGIIPGKKVTTITAEDVTMTKEQANDMMIQTLAMNKLKKEKEEAEKKINNEKLKDFLFRNEEQRFFMSYGYHMSGQQRRKVRREIDRGWKNGKFKKWVAEHGDEILSELNMPTNTMTDANPANVQAQTVTSLPGLMNGGIK